MSIQVSRGRRGISIRATGKDANALAAAMFRPLEVDEGNPAKCVGCGCTDACACEGGCWWLDVDRKARKGVCSNCGGHLQAFRAERAAPADAKAEG